MDKILITFPKIEGSIFSCTSGIHIAKIGIGILTIYSLEKFESRYAVFEPHAS